MTILKKGKWIILLYSAFIASVSASDVTITVNGKVVAKPCTIETTKATVDLGDLLTFNFIAAGSTSAWHDVTLNLTNCPVGTSQITATFSGTADSSGYYKNQGSAGSIQLELQDSGGAKLNNGSTKTIQVDNNTLSGRFPLKVRALSVSGNATQGTIQSIINVTYTWL